MICSVDTLGEEACGLYAEVFDPGGRMKSLAKLFKNIEKREQRGVVKNTNTKNAVQLMIERYGDARARGAADSVRHGQGG